MLNSPYLGLYSRSTIIRLHQPNVMVRRPAGAGTCLPRTYRGNVVRSRTQPRKSRSTTVITKWITCTPCLSNPVCWTPDAGGCHTAGVPRQSEKVSSLQQTVFLYRAGESAGRCCRLVQCHLPCFLSPKGCASSCQYGSSTSN